MMNQLGAVKTCSLGVFSHLLASLAEEYKHSWDTFSQALFSDLQKHAPFDLGPTQAKAFEHFDCPDRSSQRFREIGPWPVGPNLKLPCDSIVNDLSCIQVSEGRVAFGEASLLPPHPRLGANDV